MHNQHSATIISEIISTLQDKAKLVREIEDRAQEALEKDEPVNQYNDILFEKAELLHQLPDFVSSQIENLPEDLQNELQTRLERFASSAEQAMEVNSPFFMKMLLYPEDYQEGKNNDLEELIQYLVQLQNQ